MTTTMAKYQVCPECSGEGVKGPGFVWTQDDLAQEDPDEFAQTQQMLREGYFDTPCPFCQGKRVVTTEELQEYDDWLEVEAEHAAEVRAGC